MQNMTDIQVMLKYQQGDPQAMDELLKRYKNPIYHFAYRLSLNTAEAEDITQEVFLRLHQYKDNYRPTAEFSTWIFGICHNVFVSRWRKYRHFSIWPRKQDRPEELVELACPDPSPRELASKREFSDILKKCIQDLPFLQKEALILREFERLDYQQIAKILKKSLGAVKTLIHRGRMNLRDKLLPVIKEYGGRDV